MLRTQYCFQGVSIICNFSWQPDFIFGVIVSYKVYNRIIGSAYVLMESDLKLPSPGVINTIPSGNYAVCSKIRFINLWNNKDLPLEVFNFF